MALVETRGAPAAMYFADRSMFTKIGWNKRQRYISSLHLHFQEGKKICLETVPMELKKYYLKIKSNISFKLARLP